MPLIALITGASQGIGLATARAYTQAGHVAIMAARNTDKLNAAAEIGGEAVPTDVSDPLSVAALFETIRERHGRIDVVFNNAGSNIPPQDVGDMSFADWRRVIGVNLDGAFLIASGAVKMMKAQDPQGGRIINNGSISAHTPRPGSAAYTASKHAITGLTKTIALDGRPYSIACGQIDIGNAASDMTARMAKGVPQADGSTRAEPTMNVEHVAQAVLRMGELPLDVNILTQTIMATDMPFVGRG
jgi:NAD(P)-dependent dehydrogenase (short-subunit alcohol dehydrogenase family)